MTCLPMARIVAVAATVLAATATPAAAKPGTAARELAAAIDAMGGAKALRSIDRVRLRAHGYRLMLAQSERPGGPWIPDFDRIDQRVDFERRIVRTTIVARQWGPPVETAVSGGVAIRTLYPHTPKQRTGSGRRKSVRDAGVRLALGPERVLLTARAAGDLHAEPPVYLQDVPQQVLAFTWHHAPVRVFLNAYTSLPTAVEITRPHPYDVFWNLWGDVTTRIYYSFWMLKPGGLRYPKQWDIWRNSRLARTLLINKLELNPPRPVREPAVTDGERKAFSRQAPLDEYQPGAAAQTIAPGIVLIPGAWNTSLVVQRDGVVVLDAPISSGYSAAVLKNVKRRFPGHPVKAMVTTSNAWPHVGGVREYVARGIPLYLLHLNVPFIKRVLTAPHDMHPDELALHPRAPEFRIVSARTVVGGGSNRIELYPVRGEAGERMMLAYFPARKLLYASDLVQPKPGGGFAFPEYLDEVAAVVARENLDVKQVFAMHTPHAIPWQSVLDAIKRAQAPPATTHDGIDN